MTNLENYQKLSESLALLGSRIFLSIIVCIALWQFKRLFLQSHGISHRLAGGAHLCWLFLGAWTISSDENDSHTSWLLIFWYDLLLGLFGIAATLTAARDFPHKLVSNSSGQSGTLHKKAIVTQHEMIEHAFYQFLNLNQAFYLHSLQHVDDYSKEGNENFHKLFLLCFVTIPWLWRHRLPVHSFSHNWNVYATCKKSEESGEVFLYRIKKAQYLFYKHVILHGVNISLAVSSTVGDSIPYSTCWRVFWILLNTSYVMEFFMQSLVKANILNQIGMLWLQRFLMVVASLSAVVVLRHVNVLICSVSLILNFANRHHDLANTIGIAVVSMLWTELR